MAAKRGAKLVTVEDAMEDAGVSRSQLYDLQTCHSLRVYQVGERLVVDPAEFDAALTELRGIKP